MALPDPFGWVGSSIDGKFRLDEVVGEGGFGVVYRAHHLGFDEPVAVKCLKVPASLQGAERERFQKTFIEEGRLLHRLSRATAGIVQALDVGAATSPSGAWTPYLVLEWLRGVPLEVDLAGRRERGEGGRTLAEAIALLEPAARALDAAHAQGVAHRDVKPANLFLAEIGDRRTLKVLDFGIAKVLSEVSSLTQALVETGGSVKAFTPQYGAPEQFHRKFGATGPWTDVFALALVLVELVSGKAALDGGDTTQLYIVSTNPTHRPGLRGAGVEAPDAVEEVLRKALAVEPRDRYRSAGELWDSLLAALPPEVGAEVRAAGERRPVTREPTSPKLSAELASMPTVEFLGQSQEGAERAAPAEPGPREVSRAAPAAASAQRATDAGALAPTEPSPRARPATTTGPVISEAPAADAAIAAPHAAPPRRRGRAALIALGGVIVAGAGLGVAVTLSRPLPPPPPATHRVIEAPPAAAPDAPPPGMVRIAAGKFMMGNDAGGRTEKPTHQVTITRAFDLDRTEVTAADYARCVAAKACTPTSVHGPKVTEEEIARLGPLCTAVDPAKADHPITCVDRAQAEAYCEFAGKRLPTEAEWEYAARGGDGREFPWGKEAPGCEHAEIARGPTARCGDRPRGTKPVGSYPAGASAAGALDMAGNAWEWVADGWDPNVYLQGWRTDPLVPASGEKGVLRGGAWDFAANAAKSTFRLAFDRAAASSSTGFRCARAAP